MTQLSRLGRKIHVSCPTRGFPRRIDRAKVNRQRVYVALICRQYPVLVASESCDTVNISPRVPIRAVKCMNLYACMRIQLFHAVQYL